WNGIIRPAMNARTKALSLSSSAMPTPLSRRASILHAVRTSPGSLGGLNQFLPEGGLTDWGNPLFAQIELMTAAFKGGVAGGASVQLSSFDTHENHDQWHYPMCDDLLRAIDYLIHRLDLLGLREQVTIVVSSEFGRTPLYDNGSSGYNDKMGKDHHPISGMMLMGRGVKGGRLVGGTDDKVLPLKVNSVTLALDDVDGIILRPEMIHTALRRFAGIETNPLLNAFALDAPLLPLLEGANKRPS
ncbi:MAG: DUF1501 domain-containing protein, partial [Pseudobdellovibrionaceae bacterium]|nr:DUF1501 domain-containing protein [Pseudobdellovibrionaceae bacterium]